MSRIKNALLAVGLMIAAGQSPAEDTDLFMGLQEYEGGGRPNIIILIDNTANWNLAFPAEMAALASTIAGINETSARIGIMFYSETGGDNDNVDGAYVRAGVRSMTEDNKLLYATLLASFDVLGDKSNNGKLGLALDEVYRYLSCLNAYAGIKVKRDYAGNYIESLSNFLIDTLHGDLNLLYLTEGNAFSGEAEVAYQCPAASECDTSFLIFLSNGKSNSNTADNEISLGHLEAMGGSTTQIDLGRHNSFEGESADEWARFMANHPDHPIRTFVIDVKPSNPGQWSTDYQDLLMSMSEGNGGGAYYLAGTATDTDLALKIQEALNDILGQIAAVNSVFSSAALPVSVNTQGVYRNQVYIGMFRPDANLAPYWNGNLKQYQIAVDDTAELNLADRNGAPAVNPLTGFITPCAESYWTPVITDPLDDYWSFKEGFFTDSCSTVPGSAASNTPDGQAVEKGAAGFRLRAIDPDDRVVKTCAGDCTSLTSFDTSNTQVSALSLGVSTLERSDLINWVRGQDVDDENSNGITDEMRPSAHGDVMHSRPLAVDYGDAGVAVFYGANDGMLHAVEGDKALDDGDELWSFIAPEHYAKLARLRSGEPKIVVPTPAPGMPGRRDYFFDGPVGGHRLADSTVWIYAAMRRGGRRIYAFDVTIPAAPSPIWRIGCPNLTDDIGCDAGFTGIGQTWSTPIVFEASGYVDDDGATKPLAIFGGGYDDCEDNEPNTCSAPKGNHVYVVDAESGTLVKRFDPASARSFPADIAVIDRDANGLADMAYAADTGGNLYRIDFGDNLVADWSMTKIAALGCDAPPCAVSGELNRKFLHRPEIVVTGDYNAVLAGSGDREHPLDVNSAINVDNAFFMIKDKPGDATWLASQDTTCGGEELICMASLTQIMPDGDDPDAATLAASKGWYLSFGTDAEVDGRTVVHNGEQVVTAGIVVAGVLDFSTHTPTPDTQQMCGPNLGTARAYAVNFLSGTSATSDGVRYSRISGGGLSPSPIAGRVEIDDRIYPFKIGARQLDGGSTSSIEVQNPGISIDTSKSRSHWFIEPPE